MNLSMPLNVQELRRRRVRTAGEASLVDTTSCRSQTPHSNRRCSPEARYARC